MTQRTNEEIREAVRQAYGAIARAGGTQALSCCGPEVSCGGADALAGAMGYSSDELAAVPEGANLGLGCGNPQAIAALRPGEVVLDLGSGAGFDCFLAADRVGPEGRVLGVDMTADMIAKARSNATTVGVTNVDFRLGEIEHLPVENETVDVILSNCVINLSPDKDAVFRDAFRVLKPGGRLAISDIVTQRPLPAEVREDLAALTGCVGNAASVATIERLLADAGFENVRVTVQPRIRELIAAWLPNSGVEDLVGSATIEATKPAGASACCRPAAQIRCCAGSAEHGTRTP